MATISDVARESGVSIGTVSNVLNGGAYPVRPETRQRVLAAATRLNYHPNAMARGLVRRRSQTLGVFFGVVPAANVIADLYASSLLQGVFRIAAARGYNLLMLMTPWQDAGRSSAVFRNKQADGYLIVAPPQDCDILTGLSPLGLPLVTISAPSEEYGIPSVDVDNFAGARLATEHLLARGHRRIAHFTGNANAASVPTRIEGYRQTMAAAGAEVLPGYLLTCAYEGHGTREAFQSVMALPCPPTAIFAGNDNIAREIMTAARLRGLRLPEDLSIVGFDDSPIAPMLTVPLTTVRQPLAEIGAAATQTLIDQAENCASSPVNLTRLFAPALVERGSTAPLADVISHAPQERALP